jgi:hypothetical protein
MPSRQDLVKILAVLDPAFHTDGVTDSYLDGRVDALLAHRNQQLEDAAIRKRDEANAKRGRGGPPPGSWTRSGKMPD